jgi:rsbT co-antagonist protein RsbR
MRWLNWLVEIDHQSATVRRRGRLLAIILTALILALLLLVPIGFISPDPLASLGSTVASLAIMVAALWLVRRGRVTEAGWFFILTSIGSSLGTIAYGQLDIPLIPLFFLSLLVVTAGVVLPPRHLWAVLAACLLACVIGFTILPSAEQTLTLLITAICAAIIIAGVAVISYLGADAIQTALDSTESSAREVSQARQIAEAQARDLASQAEALRSAEQQLQELVTTLETPSVTLAEGVLMAPLVGALDTRRAQMLTQRLLQDVERQRVRLLVVDVAGVMVIDTAVAQALISIIQSVRLLGCQVVVTGIAPSVAITLVSLGVDLAGIPTARSPQDVLASRATWS